MRNNRLSPPDSRRPLEGRRCQARAFSLIELLLTVVLIMLVLGAVAFNFSTLSKGATVREATSRVESLLHLARAHAANTGRRVQLAFEKNTDAEISTAPSLWSLAFRWEPYPLEAPGLYEPVNNNSWNLAQLNDQIGAEHVFVEGALPLIQSFAATTAPTDDSAGPPPSPITFYPDGSCDNARITLAARSPEEQPQRVMISIQGTTGAIRSHLVE